MSLENGNEQEITEQENIELDVEKIDMENDAEYIDDSEELEQKKNEVNKFCAKDNHAYNQIFIGETGAGGFTLNYYASQAIPITPNLPIEKRYDLRKQADSIEFVETFKDSEYFTTAVILCIFEIVLLKDLPDLKSKLKPYLPKEIIYNTEGQEIQVSKESPYISLNTTLAVIGGKKYTMEDGQQCVSIGENSTQALANILEQFPVLRDSVTKLLIQMTQEERYCTRFFCNQLAIFLAKNISLKMVDLENNLFSNLYSNPDKVELLATFIYFLYKENEEDAKKILFQWLCVDKTWLWRPAALAYALFMENNILFPFEKELRTTIIKRFIYFGRNDFDFIASILIQSKYFRTIICSVFYYVYQHTEIVAKQKAFAKTYIYLVRRSYYKVNSLFIDLPLVACDTKQQQEYLVDILGMVMADFKLRKQIYAIIKAYLKELSHYKFSKKVIKHMAAYCYNITSSDEGYREDIIAFLQECHNKAAKQIIELL